MTLPGFLAGESSYVCWAETEGHPKLGGPLSHIYNIYQYLIPSASSLSIDINKYTYIYTVILKCVDTICNHTEMYR